MYLNYVNYLRIKWMCIKRKILSSFEYWFCIWIQQEFFSRQPSTCLVLLWMLHHLCMLSYNLGIQANNSRCTPCYWDWVCLFYNCSLWNQDSHAVNAIIKNWDFCVLYTLLMFIAKLLKMIQTYSHLPNFKDKIPYLAHCSIMVSSLQGAWLPFEGQDISYWYQLTNLQTLP